MAGNRIGSNEHPPGVREKRTTLHTAILQGVAVLFYSTPFVLTHYIPLLGNGGYVHDHLTGFLEEVKERAKFHYWLFGHYHDNKIINDRFVLLWEQMVQVV